MKILAIDSSSTPASIAVTNGETPIGEFTININRTHSEKLLPIADALLDAINLSVSDIDAFAVSIGPGSFTGLRIGMSAAKLMAQISGKPLIGVKTLEALAANVSVFGGYIVPVLDARNDTFYSAVYKCTNCALSEQKESSAILIDDFCKEICALDMPVLVTGEYYKYIDKIKPLISSKSDIYFAPGHLASQRATSCALLAYKQYCSGNVSDPQAVVPLYVRESQAEQAKKAREAKAK